MDEIIRIIGSLLGAIFISVIVYASKILVPKVKEWLSVYIDNEYMTYFETLIGEFCKAADQLYKADDPTGEIRNNYVKTELEKLGIIITSKINAIIESKVFDLPKESKESVDENKIGF